MGTILGLIFGMLDIEDESLSHLRIALLNEEHYCYPIGFLLGAVAGYLNEKFRYTNDYETFSDADANEI